MIKLIEKIPSKPGVYLLIINVKTDVEVKTRNRLFKIPKGYYVYIGSAKNTGGLYSRVKRYFSPIRNKFWHIDYLVSKPGVELVGLIYREISDRGYDWESYLAEKIRSNMQFIKGFGCSDKKWNTSHLYKCGDYIEECLFKLMFLRKDLFKYILLNHLVYKPL